MTLKMKIFGLAILAMGSLSGPTAMAQETESPSAQRVFTPDYFEQFAPQNARDMVRRVPGIQIQGGNNNRGLGQGGANVLLNGQPITGKGDDPFDQIGRIPASNVVRIEILDASSLDIPGLTGQVVNVVASASEGLSGSWQWHAQWRKNHEPEFLRGNVKVAGKTGNLSYAAEVGNQAFRFGLEGPEVRRNADGTIFEEREFLGRFIRSGPEASVNLTWTPTDDQTGNLNIQLGAANINRENRSLRTAVGEFVDNPPIGVNNGENGREANRFGEDEIEGGIDGDYEFPFLDGRLKLIGLYNYEHSPIVSRFFDYDVNDNLVEQTEFNRVENEGEAIFKTEFSWSSSPGRDWQVSLEGAHNFLDFESEFIDRLDAANNSGVSALKVSENRGEGFLTHTRRLSDQWSAQASIGAEYSELTTGDQTRTFARPKGFVSATYAHNDTTTFSAKFERRVGQLNFGDFLSVVALDEEVSDRSTNFNLVPDQSWWGELKFNKTFKGGHAFDVLVSAGIVEDIVDQIPLDVDVLDAVGNVIGTDFTTGVGNIGSGEQGGVRINGTLKGDDIGFSGMELRAGAGWGFSNVTDPITGESRQFSGQRLSDWEIEFRHDIPDTPLAWGFEFETFEDGSVFRPFEISRNDERPGENEVFVEHKDLLGMKVRIQVNSPIEAGRRLDRRIFSTRRDLPGSEISRIENRRFDFKGPVVRLRISDTF